MSYNRKSLERVQCLLRRAEFLTARLTPSHHFDRAECSAIRWALEAIVEVHGALPEDLEAWRVAIWAAGNGRHATQGRQDHGRLSDDMG